MEKKHFTDEQITYVPRQAENGVPMPDICRQMGCSEASFRGPENASRSQ